MHDQYEQIDELSKGIHDLVENHTNNFNKEQTDELHEKFKLLVEQIQFWEEQENVPRQIYDLKSFSVWLCDYICDVETNFWGEEEAE